MIHFSDYLKEWLMKVKKYVFYKARDFRVKDGDNEVREEQVRYPDNHKRFPFNILEPDVVTVGDQEYKRYRAKFYSLHDLYEYIKAHPEINKRTFSSLSSITGSSEFAGLEFDEAVEELENEPRDGYRDFLQLCEELDEEALNYVQEHIIVKAPGGGYIDIPSYASGDPFCYRIGRSTYTPKFIRINVMLSYYWGTTKKQVLHRALIVAALVSAFEKAGYVVEVNTFELSEEYDELIEIDVNIKNSNETLNKASLYKSLCYVEFLRRILFRVLETLNVKNDWQNGYGHTCSESFSRRAMHLGENDIFIDQPSRMNINGNDISKDFIAVLEHLNIADKIDIKSVTEEFEREAMRLAKTIK